jgi:hypothetical protein
LRSKEGGWGIYGGDSREARDCLLFYSERESETVCDREEIFGDARERLVVFMVHEEFEYKFPTLIR